MPPTLAASIDKQVMEVGAQTGESSLSSNRRWHLQVIPLGSYLPGDTLGTIWAIAASIPLWGPSQPIGKAYASVSLPSTPVWRPVPITLF